MARTLEQFHRDLISGQSQGIAAAIMRGMLNVAEPFYAMATTLRNRRFDRDPSASHEAPRKVISIGNITTGGTGKTPVVRWLVQRLRESGHTPAILMRGYKSKPGSESDEQRLLQSFLPGTLVEANPNRVLAAQRVAAANPTVDLFVLDDGFQHRRLRRDFDLVLIDASNPFGFDRVLPRGLLREPLDGLRRASAFLITHCELVDQPQLRLIESVLKERNPSAPIYRSRHVQTGIRMGERPTQSITTLAGKKVVTVCGIGNPDAFESQLKSAGADIVASRRFADHHHYTLADLLNLQAAAGLAAAELVLTTEKDWIKLAGLIAGVPNLPPVYRTELEIRFEADDEQKLLSQIQTKLASQVSQL